MRRQVCSNEQPQPRAMHRIPTHLVTLLIGLFQTGSGVVANVSHRNTWTNTRSNHIRRIGGRFAATDGIALNTPDQQNSLVERIRDVKPLLPSNTPR